MKIRLIGYNNLKRALILEGDEIVEKGEDLLLNEETEGIIPLIVVNSYSPGFKFFTGPEFYSITKRFKTSWNNQTLITFPLPTLMNGDLGYPEESGRVGRYVQENPHQNLFDQLKQLLDEMKYDGFITMKFNINKQLIDISFGAGMALYNILEGVKGRLSEFFKDMTEVMESWTASLVLSKYPYPFIEIKERTFIKLNPSMEKHLWFYELNNFRNSYYTDNTKICIVTAWATTLNEVAKRVYRTCQGIDVPMKQHRTDIEKYIADRWTMFINPS